MNPISIRLPAHVTKLLDAALPVHCQTTADTRQHNRSAFVAAAIQHYAASLALSGVASSRLIKTAKSLNLTGTTNASNKE